MKMPQAIALVPVIILLWILPALGGSQSLPFSREPSPDPTSVTALQPSPSYVRPTHGTMARNYSFDAFGPYPAMGAAIAAGIGQFDNSPPEWMQGAGGFGKRFGSSFAMAAVGTTTRYALSEVFKDDTLYYRCECNGFIPRVGHAMISTLTARRGQDGHRVFSMSAFLAPYAGSTTAVYGWYPGRFGAKDAFRLGNYNMLIYMGGNVSLEFLYSGPHSLLSRMHMNNAHGAPDPGPNH